MCSLNQSKEGNSAPCCNDDIRFNFLRFSDFDFTAHFVFKFQVEINNFLHLSARLL